MVNPYYSDKDCVIYHADINTVIDDIAKTYEIDLVITDPPYGMNYLSNYYSKGNPFGAISGDSDKYPTDMINRLRSIADKAVYAFCRWDILPLIISECGQPKSVIAWIKNNWTAGDITGEYARQWETICFWPTERHEFINGRPQDVMHENRVAHQNLIHPTEKPVNLARRMLLNSRSKTIFDPYMGSGFVLEAAKSLNRFCIGVEIEERYCDLAVKRISQEVINYALGD